MICSNTRFPQTSGKKHIALSHIARPEPQDADARTCYLEKRDKRKWSILTGKIVTMSTFKVLENRTCVLLTNTHNPYIVCVLGSHTLTKMLTFLGTSETGPAGRGSPWPPLEDAM